MVANLDTTGVVLSLLDRVYDPNRTGSVDLNLFMHNQRIFSSTSDTKKLDKIFCSWVDHLVQPPGAAAVFVFRLISCACTRGTM